MPPRKGWIKIEIVCPIHRIALTEKTDISFKECSITVAFCPRCKCVYSNNSSAITNKITLNDGREVVWSNLHMLYADSQKKQTIKVVVPAFYNRPINIVRKTSKLLAGENVIEAVDKITHHEAVVADIKGFFDVQEKKFYTTPNVFTLTKITARPLDIFDISDPDNLLSEGKKTKLFLQAWQADVAKKKQTELDKEKKKQRREQYKQKLMESAFPGQLYSVPLLRAYGQRRCPYCHKLIREKKIVRCVVYRESVPHHCIFVELSYCGNCDIPLCTQEKLANIRNDISPDIVKVVYAHARVMPTKDKLLALCYEKVERLEHKDPPKLEGKSLPYQRQKWEEEMPNLSALPASNAVYIYSKKCSCKRCQHRFGRDTIADRKATVLTKNGKSIDINVQFCMGCGRYFMNIKSLYAYQKLYGDLRVSLHFNSNVEYVVGDMWAGFADDSVLSRHGYNVKAGTSIANRRRILSWILTEGIATKHEVISLLTQFIQLHQTTKPGACARWREDLLFVNQFELERQENSGRKELVQGSKISTSQKE